MTKNKNLSRSQFPVGHVPDLVTDFGGPQPGRSEGSQGTLWSTRKSNAYYRTGDEPGHKGFSQNRLNAVRENVETVDASLMKPSGRSERGNDVIRTAWANKGERVAAGRPEWPLPSINQGARNVTEADIHETIAKTNVPIEHIRDRGNPQGISIKSKEDMPTVRGAFTPFPSSRAAGRGVVFLRSDTVTNPTTVAHELGHAHDFFESGHGWKEIPGETTGESRLESDLTPHRMAKVEAYADAYADRFSGVGPVPSTYENYKDESWSRYAAHVLQTPRDALPAEQISGVGAGMTYRKTRARHGGLDLSRVRPKVEQHTLF